MVVGWVGADLREPVHYPVEQAPKGRHRPRIGTPTDATRGRRVPDRS